LVLVEAIAVGVCGTNVEIVEGKYHIPPDLVVKCQGIDYAEVIFQLVW
jgi:hypothetical protein